MKKFLSIGYGNVGQAIPERARTELGLAASDYVIRSDGIYKKGRKISDNPRFWEEKPVLKDVAVAFLTIPSFSDGKRAYEVINGLLACDIPVVTSEKGALANFYAKLEPQIDRIGISATVGGGTGMMSYLAQRVNPRTNQIHVILNGTLNFIMHGISEGGTAGQIIEQAVTLGYAEPGAANHLEVLNGEIIGDIPKKTSILWNTVMRPRIDKKHFLLASDILRSKQAPKALTQSELNRLISEAGSRRYIVSIIRTSEEIPEKDIIIGFREEVAKGWVIIGGFRCIDDNPLFKALRLPGPGNGAVIASGPNEADGVYNTSGPGAGPGPTAAAMVNDARRFLQEDY